MRFSLSLVVLLLLTACAAVSTSPTRKAAIDPLLWNDPPVDSTQFCPVNEEELTGNQPADDITVAEPESTAAEEIEDLIRLGAWEEGTSPPPREEQKYDFPVTINRQVEYYLDFFQNRQPRTFARWLRRSGRYLPLIRQRLREAGLPLDLAWLPMIESGFSLTAYSRAGAAGPWQFMKGTARHYGLTVNRYVDQRRDIIAATDAAITFLQELYAEFDSWPLAVAGYNAGAGTIRRAIRKTGSKNFWDIAKSRYLRTETKRYVPKLIAAIIIAKEPEKFGFGDVEYDPPLEFDTVEVPRWTPLRAVAVASGVDFETIRNLNRELRQAMTPPDTTYKLKVPRGRGDEVAANLPLVRAIVRTSYKTHVVRPRDSIDRICRRYQISKTTLLKANDLRKTKLSAGRRLRIPVQTTEYRIVDPSAPALAGGALVMHRVQPGETLSTIAARYNVSTWQLVTWNDIRNPNRIRAGSRLALYLAGPDDNADDISGKPVITASRKKQRPTNKPRLRLTYYEVRNGDSLWKIARRFKLTTKDIRSWNNLKGNLIHPGTRLLLKLPADIDV